MKKKIKKCLIILLVFILCVAILAMTPFINQPHISSQTIDEVSQTVFTDDSIGDERAWVIEDNQTALEERIRLISHAQNRIILSTFEMRSDESGKDILAALIDAAKRGVSVQVLIDGTAEMTRMKNNSYFIALSSLDNAQIKIYNSISLFKPWKLMGRMHDKYLIVDDFAYMIGGRNTYDYFLGNQGYQNYDWDVLIYQQSHNQKSSLYQLVDYFESIWNMSLCQLYHDDLSSNDNDIIARQELKKRYQDMKINHSSWFENRDYEKSTLPTHHIELIHNPIHCDTKEPIVYYTLTELMYNSHDEVRFHTPYIICNDWMLNRIEQICAKVPSVTMMTNSVANNGNPFGAMDYQKNKDKILETRLNILEYDGGVSYHGKCMTIDDRLSAIGSFNWDMRSTYIDTETMVVIDSQEVNADLKLKMSHYEKDTLKAVDHTNDNTQNNHQAQEISILKQIQLYLMQLFIGWLRFLM